MVLPHKFPTQIELAHVTELRNYRKLYELKQKAVLGLHDKIVKEYKNERDIVYIAHAIPSRVADFYGDFVQGDETRLIIAPPNDSETSLYEQIIFENDLVEKVYDMGVEQSEFGYFILHTYLDDQGVPRIDLVPQDTFFPQPDGSVVIATYRAIEGVTSEFAVLTQHYMVVNGNVQIERKAWRANNTGVIFSEIPLAEMEKLLGKELLPTATIQNLDELPFTVGHNGRKQFNGYGKSDFFDILPNLAEVNERATHVSTQLLKNLSARLILPASKGLVDEKGNAIDWDVLVVDGKDNIDPKYLTNSNPLIPETMEFIMYQLRHISWVTGVPMFELIASGAPERVESMRIRLYSAVRKTNTKRSKVKRALKDALRIATKLKGMKVTDDANIEMSDVLPIDELVEAQVEETKVRAGLTSRRSAIMRLNNLTEEEAEEEMKQIATEDRVAGVVGAPENAPTL